MTAQLNDRAELEKALHGPEFLLFKHSRACPVSARAFAAYEEFVADHPEVPTGYLDVVAQRPWSQWVAAEFGVEHQSPQAILFRMGRVVWDQSHRRITVDALGEAVSGRQ